MNKKINKIRLGFTLIELLVVIAIIGILASIVLASLNSARVKARDARRTADLNQMRLALELYGDSNGQKYASATATCDPTTARGLQALAPTYISVVPRDPVGDSSNNCYKYASQVTSALWYHLGATLEQAGQITPLAADRDCNSQTAGSCSTTGTGDQGFSGLSVGCSTTISAAAVETCYDITN